MSEKVTAAILALVSKNQTLKPPQRTFYLDNDHPKAHSCHYRDKGQYVGMPDYVFEELMNFILNDETGELISQLKDALVLARMSIDEKVITNRQNDFDDIKKKHIEGYNSQLQDYERRMQVLQSHSTNDLIDIIINEVKREDYISSFKVAALGAYYRDSLSKGDIDPAVRPNRIPEYLESVNIDDLVKHLESFKGCDTAGYSNIFHKIMTISKNIGWNGKFNADGERLS